MDIIDIKYKKVISVQIEKKQFHEVDKNQLKYSLQRQGINVRQFKYIMNKLIQLN